MSTASHLRSRALGLTEADRASLAHELLLSLDPPPSPELTKEQWRDEIAMEEKRIENGEAVKLGRRESVERARISLEHHRKGRNCHE